MDSTTNSQRRPFSIKLWPPSESTRQVLVQRLTNNLTSNSIFTQKYGALNKEEAEENAKKIEDIAFNIAHEQYDREPDGDGGAAVQLYAKECSKLLLDVLKRGPASKEEKKELASEEDATFETFFDISKGQRAFIEAEEAESLLKPLKEPGNRYTKICFSNRSFGLGAARVAEPILVSLKNQLKEADLSDFIAGRPEAEALEVMNIFSSALEGCVLRYLNLSNNALGEKGVRAFGALLKSQSCLEELYLMNDGISEEAAKAVSELIPSTEKLKVLHFHNNMTGDEGALAIADVVKRSLLLEDFRCSSTRVGSEGGVALSEALECCTYLKKLDLRDNMFGVEAGVPLSKALSKHLYLVEVYLNYLNLEDEGAIAVANALKESAPSLEVLEMAGNDITVDSAPSIAACIAAKQHLTKLNLAENELKDEGTIAVANALKESAPSLEVLEMAGNDITADAAPSIAACIAAKQYLTKLNLAENELKDEGTILISKALEEGHAHLKEVDMNTNFIRRAGARHLAQVVVQKPGFTLLNINGNIISDDGVDEVKEIFKKSPDMLGSLDENDPEGGDDDEESGEGEANDDELESKMKNLEVNQEE
ncbi:hypothetical protein PTKIN_Ptkin09bG0067300 [Pterospermum kingtungense]